MEKNEILGMFRGVSFEEIRLGVEEGRLLDVIKNPNFEKYPQQYMLVVNIKNYVYLIPFVEESEYIFLKTIIPSRKATKAYLED